MWKWFFPKAQIVGLDIFDKSFVDSPRIKRYQGSQTDPEVMARGSSPSRARRWSSSTSTDRDSKETTMALVKGLVDGLNHEEFLDEDYEPTYTDRRVVGVLDAHTSERIAALESTVTALRRQLAPEPPGPLTGADVTTSGEQAVSELRFDGDRPSLVLVLHAFTAGQIFAGVRTTVMAAAALADGLALPLRVLVIDPTGATLDETLDSLRRLLRQSTAPALADSVRVSMDGARDSSGHHRDDVWLVTFWPTAWAVDGLVEDDLVRRDRVVYLIQDWEPSFYPSGDLNAKALSTYDAGFTPIVNSAPLARYFADQTGTAVDPQCVFAPELDFGKLEESAARWQPGKEDEVRVLFYARPSKPRNMLNLGLQALRLWADGLPEGITPVVRLAGEPMGPVDLGARATAEVLGKTTYEEYHELLSDTDIGLALMNSPHPGHLALELPLTSIPTVTNRFGTYRSAWADELILADPHPRALAAALEEARTLADGRREHRFGTFKESLGGGLRDAAGAAAARLGPAG